MCDVDGWQIVLEPLGQAALHEPSPGAGRRAPGGLEGKRVGIVDNKLLGMSVVADALERALVELHRAHVLRWIIPHSIEPQADVLATISSSVDVVVIGLGNCGACTTWQCGLSTMLRDNLIPTLDVVTEPFAALARSVFAGQGLPTQPLAILPAGIKTFDQDAVLTHAHAVAEACSKHLVTGSIP